MYQTLRALALAAGALCSNIVHSQSLENQSCSSVTKANLLPCALKNSGQLLSHLHQLAAAQTRKDVAGAILPSNPVLSGSIASRTSTEASAINWYLNLSQELEIAGQRTARINMAEAEVDIQKERMEITRRKVCELAWTSFIHLAAALKQKAVADEAERAALALTKSAQALAQAGAGTTIDAELAFVRSLQATKKRIQSTAAVALAQQQLSFVVGVPASIENSVEALTLSVPIQEHHEHEHVHLEAKVIATQITANEAKIDLLYRSFIPNPSLSATVQNDGFNERVLGIGISLPIPLPSPVVRTPALHIEETKQERESLKAQLEFTQKEILLEETQSQTALSSAKELRANLTAEQVKNAEQSLLQLQQEVAARRLSIREGLLAQEALLELLFLDIEFSQNVALAVVEFVRAHHMNFEGINQ
jgi:outer membrane protein, heavy metal efflux system